MSKKFILNSDDFGVSSASNRAVEEAYQYNLLKSVSITPNSSAFNDAINIITQKMPDIGVGVHLNLTEGKSLCSDVNLLTNSDMQFNNSYLTLLIKVYNPKEKDLLPQIEREFRRQIETVLAKTRVSHIDSHSHIHSIPPIFNMVCRLAKEYKIPYVRTHFEKFYFVPEFIRHMHWSFYKNLAKKLILNFFTIINENTIHKYKLKTNDYLIGISYGLKMDAIAVAYGIKAIKGDNVTVEAFIHPHRYEEGTIDDYFCEYLITRNKKLSEKLINSGYDITNYFECSAEAEAKEESQIETQEEPQSETQNEIQEETQDGIQPENEQESSEQ